MKQTPWRKQVRRLLDMEFPEAMSHRAYQDLYDRCVLEAENASSSSHYAFRILSLAGKLKSHAETLQALRLRKSDKE